MPETLNAATNPRFIQRHNNESTKNEVYSGVFKRGPSCATIAAFIL